MIDIHFYRKFGELKKKIMKGNFEIDRHELFDILEEMRSKFPVVYELETTNVCNMQCYMCPRTRMKRSIGDMSDETFEKTITQIKPFSSIEWYTWVKFVEDYYGIKESEVGENHFFTYIIPKVITLHGYGEPVLDKKIIRRIKRCTELQIPSYLSCNPGNIRYGLSEKMFEAGLDYLKFSTDSANSVSMQQIRGKNAVYSLDDIDKIIKLKEDARFKTTIVLCMLDLNREGNYREFRGLKKRFEGRDVYVYFKSRNALWLDGGDTTKNKSIHWNEPCQFPWSSMTVHKSGDCVQCITDHDNVTTLGNVNEESLWDIWNGEAYRKLRLDHLTKKNVPKCSSQCDAKLLGELI